MKSKNILIIFSKSPEDIQSKSRLRSDYPDEWVEQLNLLFIESLQEKFQSTEKYDVVWALAKESDHPLWKNCETCFQIGNGLGERLKNIWNIYKSDYENLVVIGSDTPHLTKEMLTEVFLGLQDKKSAIGLAEDGGFYVFGTQADFAPEIFLRLSYSMENTGAQLYSLLIDPFELPVNFDIDVRTDIEKLRKYLNNKKKLTKKENDLRLFLNQN